MILLAVGIFVIMQKQYTISEQSANQKAVEQYIQSCFEPTAYDAVYLAGLQGGYLQPEDSIDNPAREQYYYYYYKDISPNLTTMYKNMQRYSMNHTLECIRGLAVLYNLSVDEDSASLDVSSSETDTLFTLHLPVIITEQNHVSTLNTFTTTVPASLEKQYAIARQITDTITASDPLVCMTCLQEIAESQNVFLSITEYQELSEDYILTDPSMILYDAPVVFIFKIHSAEDYDISAYFEKESQLTLGPLTYNATIGEEFSLNVNTEEFLQHVVPQFIAKPEYNLTFADFTPLFDINPILGTITFTPAEEQKGNYSILLKIEDNQGNVEYTTLKLVIK
jgi:hypothetical protein